MNWNDPQARAQLAQRVGIAEYSRQLQAHHASQVVATINGRKISRVATRFGILFAIEGTGRAHATQAEAATEAETLPCL